MIKTKFLRKEEKFLLSFSQYIYLKNLFKCALEPDPYSNSKGIYPVASIYFDTLDDRFYYQKTYGEQKHCKLRLRYYGSMPYKDNKSFWLESKLKSKSWVKKFREPIELDSAITSERFYKVLKHSKEFSRFQNLSPKCVVHYYREAFVRSKEATDLRINFDHKLTAHDLEFEYSIDSKNQSNLLDDKILLEVKYEKEMPSWLREVMTNLKLRKTEFSKYQRGRLYLSKMKQ